MSDALKELMAKKSAENEAKAKQIASLKNGTANNQTTKIQSSTETVPVQQPVILEIKKKEIDKNEIAAAVYEDLTLRRFFKSFGQKILPKEGYFYAKDQEEVDMLDLYAKRGLVLKVNDAFQ